MSTTLQNRRPTTLSDIVSGLGNVALERIRWDPRPGTASEADAICAEHCELIDGVLVEKAMGYPESRIAQVLAWYLEIWASRTQLGFVIGDGAMTRMQSGNLRIPDVYVARWERVPHREVPQDAVSSIVPHLAVEVISPGNTNEEIERKRNEYFASGVERIWVVRPETETIDVWTSPDAVQSHSSIDTVDGGTTVPGFKIPAHEIFEAARRGAIDVQRALMMLQGNDVHGDSVNGPEAEN